MTVRDLLSALCKHRIKYVKIHVSGPDKDEVYIYNTFTKDRYKEIYKHFGDHRVHLWRADFGDSIYIEV